MSSTAQPKRAILITGATGKQGGATIDALLDAGALNTHTILAVTRNAESGSAKKLASRGIKLVQGDLNDVPAVFRDAKTALGGDDAEIWGVFSVQLPMGKGASTATEESQGKALVDAALAHTVKLFVYTSGDRGGEAVSYGTPTVVPHFASKQRVEVHLVERTRAAGTAMRWTILRPVAFMENLTPDFVGRVFTTAWRLAVPHRKLQLVSSRDVGWFAAQAFLRPGDFAGREISLAGDELTLAEANGVFKTRVGNEMPETYQFVARLLMWFSAELGSMFRWFSTDGFGADIMALRKEHAGMISFSDWLDHHSAWDTKKLA